MVNLYEPFIVYIFIGLLAILSYKYFLRALAERVPFVNRRNFGCQSRKHCDTIYIALTR